MHSNGRTLARLQIMTRPRRSPASSPSPPVVPIEPGSVPRRWFATIAAVSRNQKRERPVSTLPLSGIGVGRTTSKAEMRSEATSSSRLSSRRYRSRTFPARSNVLAGDTGLRLQVVEPRDDRWDVLQEGSIVEAGIQAFQRQVARHLLVDCQELRSEERRVGKECRCGGSRDQ